MGRREHRLEQWLRRHRFAGEDPRGIHGLPRPPREHPGAILDARRHPRLRRTTSASSAQLAALASTPSSHAGALHVTGTPSATAGRDEITAAAVGRRLAGTTAGARGVPRPRRATWPWWCRPARSCRSRSTVRGSSRVTSVHWSSSSTRALPTEAAWPRGRDGVSTAAALPSSADQAASAADRGFVDAVIGGLLGFLIG